MTTILTRLGWPDTLARRLLFLAIIGSCSGAWLALGAFATRVGVPAPVFQAAVWAGWIVWLAHYFPAHRDALLAAAITARYSRAFYRHILPGIAIAFSQVLRPIVFVAAGWTQSSWRLVLAMLIAAGGLATIAFAARALGVARALFVYEYEPTPSPVVHRGIYRHVRHPMFLGGVFVSIGGAIAAADSAALWVAAVNLAALLPYRRAEDSRCRRVFGGSYAEYSSAVGAFVPCAPAVYTRELASIHGVPPAGGGEA